MASEERLSRAALAAIAAAGVALVLAVVTVVVVLGRDRGGTVDASSAVIEVEADPDALIALTKDDAVVSGDGLTPAQPTAIGLAAGDVLLSFGGRPLKAPGELRLAMRQAIRQQATTFLFELRRDGARRVVRITARGPVVLPVERYTGPTTTPSDPDPDIAAVVAGITRIDDSTVEVTRAAVDAVLANPMPVARGARVMPSIKNGVANGFKLYAIRPSSVYAALGFANGDTLTAINGEELTSMDRALEIYSTLRDATEVRCDVIRRGQTVTLTMLIK